MKIRECRRQASEDSEKVVKQIVFEGERFDVMSVRSWRERVLAECVH